MQSVTVPYLLLITVAVTLAVLTLTTTALTIQQSSARRAVDLSRPSPHTNRTDCPRPGCTIVHPRAGRHRADPQPDTPFKIVIATLALVVRGGRRRHHRRRSTQIGGSRHALEQRPTPYRRSARRS
ncbi:hypothetical protein FB566_2536 [Stackebrandtia endophytica]|uniref:Uncharacterized protein n=1 Tax=Stackebrandtia endophytica TaxID=1496996 RepID=A0A543AWP1_9ACTN|nr:hypothetical protein FB566_2536 [Stackebrandtia endophytica]